MLCYDILFVGTPSSPSIEGARRWNKSSFSNSAGRIAGSDSLDSTVTAAGPGSLPVLSPWEADTEPDLVLIQVRIK